MSENVFVLDASKYKRSIKPVTQYMEQSATYLSKQLSIPYQDALVWIKDKVTNNQLAGVVDPKLTCYVRDEAADRNKVETTLKNYLKDSLSEGNIMAPSMTTYLRKNQVKSYIADFLEANIARRKVAKKLAFVAANNGDVETGIFKGNEQKSIKTASNSVSGAHTIPSTIIYNRTAHSTLTSNCRTIAGFGNSNNEKLISGNRHYWRPDIVINNITSIITETDMTQLAIVMAKYGIRAPTVAETCACIKYSTDLYWSLPTHTARIDEYVAKLSDLDRSAFVYTSDLWHLKEYNPAFIKEFLGRLSALCNDDKQYTVSDAHEIPEDYLNLAHQICSGDAKGMGKRYDDMLKDGKLNSIVSTGHNIVKVLDEYKDFIRCFFVTSSLPVSVAYLPDSMRRVVLVSDTDSTIFTTQEWVKWYSGNYDTTPVNESIAATVAFIASMTITHILASYSKNVGIADDRLFTLGMKSEFYWPVFIPTNLGKHYMALRGTQEGNVAAKLDKEIKGVHLVSSNLPRSLNAKGKDIMDKLLMAVYENKDISLTEYIQDIADTERSIIKSLLSGDIEFYRLSKIKTAESYTKESTSSPYQHHLLWQSVFEPKYGAVGEPTYSVIKVPTVLNNITAINNWLNGIQDLELRDRLDRWLKEFSKDALPTMYISSDYVTSHGLPIEISSVLNTRSIVSDLCNSFYIILESLGHYIKSDRILSDDY